MNARHLFLVLALAIWPVTGCGGDDPGADDTGGTGEPTDTWTGDDVPDNESDAAGPDVQLDDAGPDVPPVEPPPEQIPLESTAVGTSAEANLVAAGGRLQEAFEWLKDSETLGCVLGDDEEDEETEPVDPVPPEEMKDDDEPFSLLTFSEDVADFLTEDVMTTVESTDGETVLYLIDPVAIFCEEEEDGVETIDEECAAKFEGVVAQMRAVSFAEGDLDLTLIINGFEPVILQLHGDGLGADIDLAAVRSAWDAIKDGFADDEDGSLPLDFDTLEGSVFAALDLTAQAPIGVQVAATTAISLAGAIDGETLTLNLPASQLTASLDLAAGLLDVAGALGVVDATVAGELITKIFGDGCDDDEEEPLPPGEEPEPCVPNELTGVFTLDLPGLSAAALVDDALANIAVQDLMLGDDTTTVSREGQTVMTLDLNAALNRTVNVTLGLCDDAAQVAVDPALEVSAMFALAPLTATYPDLEGSWLEDDTLGITFDGTSPSVDLDPLQVVSGTLAVTSASRPGLDLSVTAGQCFQLSEPDDEESPEPLPEPEPDEEEDDDDHPLAEMAVTECEG